MKYVCPTCYNIVNIADIKKSAYGCHRNCINLSCDGTYLLIDDMMVDICIKFWKIGIKTVSCCYGHLYKPKFNPHIGFDINSINIQDLESCLTESVFLKLDSKLNAVRVRESDYDIITKIKIQSEFLSTLYNIYLYISNRKGLILD